MRKNSDEEEKEEEEGHSSWTLKLNQPQTVTSGRQKRRGGGGGGGGGEEEEEEETAAAAVEEEEEEEKQPLPMTPRNVLGARKRLIVVFSISWMAKATITSGLLLARSEVLRSLRHCLLAQSQAHHTIDRLGREALKEEALDDVP